jgi:hypothetical protein
VLVGPLEEAFVQRKDGDVLDVARDEPAQSEEPEDDFYVPGDDVPIDKILAGVDEPVSGKGLKMRMNFSGEISFSLAFRLKLFSEAKLKARIGALHQKLDFFGTKIRCDFE